MKKEQKGDTLKGPGKFKSMNKQATYLEVKEMEEEEREGEEEEKGEEGGTGRRRRKREESNISKYATVHYDVEMGVLWVTLKETFLFIW